MKEKSSMPPDPGSPADWLRFARSDLKLAQTPPEDGILVETLCFHAQQAVEKCLKAVLIAEGIPFSRTHNLRILLDLLPDMVSLPVASAAVAELTDFAVSTRYPGHYEPVSDAEYARAVEIARTVVAWTEDYLQRNNFL